MDFKNIIEKLVLLIPFGGAFGYWGISDDTSKGLVAVTGALVISILLYVVKQLQERHKYQREAKKLDPQFDYIFLRELTDLYIPTMFQNASPTRQDEPEFSHKYVVKQKLIPFFLKTAFNQKKESERFYLILADSGMGKTTFMVNLYMNYVSFWNRNRDKDLKIKLFRLGYADTLDKVKSIKGDDAINTLLLLDALDEDPHILPKHAQTDEEAFQQRLDEIIETTKNFREVVITCRTQYFPGQEEDPYELKIQRPNQKGFYILNKLYISPFDDKEVDKYLKMKYPFWKIGQREQKKCATQIVKKIKLKLIVRPMLLSYIHLLTKDVQKYETAYTIYENLIEQWLIREAEKRKPLKEQKQFIENLRKVSEHTALKIYQQRKTNSALFLTRDQAIAIAQQNNVELKPDEVTGKSLLTCDGQGNWKFAHKSIFEFFIAKHAIANFSFNIQLTENNFAGLDMTKLFCKEKGIYHETIFVKGGSFLMGSNEREDEKPIHQVTLSDYYMGKYPVTVGEFKIFMEETAYQTDADKGDGSYIWDGKEWKKTKGVNWQCDVKGKKRPESEYNHPVIHVSWNDAVAYCEWLTQKSREKGEPKTYRLPTEAEWEYAAGGGNGNTGNGRTRWAGTDKEEELEKYAWYSKNSNSQTQPVNTKLPNLLGIYDMSGNVWEWCLDSSEWKDSKVVTDTYKDGVVNPLCQIGSFRVLRGGSWYGYASYCRVAFRSSYTPSFRNDYFGFRLVCAY